jgi:uncharacterized LabA/DUF88 family protein
MAAYLIVDLDRILRQFAELSFSIDPQEMAVALRGRAALAAGVRPEHLKAIAVADWGSGSPRETDRIAQIYTQARFELFDMPADGQLADALLMNYFSFDPEPVSELILVTVGEELMPLIERIKTTRNARVRFWGLQDTLSMVAVEYGVIFQDLRELLGIETRNVALYIDFENIAISLSQQGFLVNLDRVIAAFVQQAKAHGHVVKMSAYAPWGSRGALPPLLDGSGQDITSEAQARLAYANIDPVFNLPGKNSADVKIVSDVVTHSTSSETADVYILATGDRDFNQVVNVLSARGKTVLIWAVRGALSRQLAGNLGVSVEFIEDFTNLQTLGSRSGSSPSEDSAESFNPSQWASIVLQFDQITAGTSQRVVREDALLERLVAVKSVLDHQRGEDLLTQAESLGLLKVVDARGTLSLNDAHPIVEKTRLIRDRITLRVQNTLAARNWMYVNYGFLLKGLAMDREIERPGLNKDDQWRSQWIDFLVREALLIREVQPHHINPEDLVPVIKMADDVLPAPSAEAAAPISTNAHGDATNGAPDEHAPYLRPVQLELDLDALEQQSPATTHMARRIIVSVEQFTSYRKFDWCPLGSLHNRLRLYDTSMAFQSAVEYLVYHGAVAVNEYANPQSNFNTKGISLALSNNIVKEVIEERDEFIRLLLSLYRRDVLISAEVARELSPALNHELWFSIMERENVLNGLGGRPGFYSLFRTHHTVVQVATQMGDFAISEDDGSISKQDGNSSETNVQHDDSRLE